MTIQNLAWFIKQIDDLTDRQFETLHNIITIRAMRRAKARYPTPQQTTEENQKDCDPNRGD